MKRLIVGGMERVYEIGRIFVTEGMDATHNLNSLRSVYQTYADFHDIMDLTGRHCPAHAAKAVHGDGPIDYQEQKSKNHEPSNGFHMVDAIKNHRC